jgi:hypothetical protein
MTLNSNIHGMSCLPNVNNLKVKDSETEKGKQNPEYLAHILRLSCSAQKEKILPDTGQVALVQSLPSTSVHFQLATS